MLNQQMGQQVQETSGEAEYLTGTIAQLKEDKELLMLEVSLLMGLPSDMPCSLRLEGKMDFMMEERGKGVQDGREIMCRESTATFSEDLGGTG